MNIVAQSQVKILRHKNNKSDVEFCKLLKSYLLNIEIFKIVLTKLIKRIYLEELYMYGEKER